MYFPFAVERLEEPRVACPVGTLCEVGHYLNVNGAEFLHVTREDGKISLKRFSGKRWVNVEIKEHDGKIVSDCMLPIYYHNDVFTTTPPSYPTISEGGIYVKDRQILIARLHKAIAELKGIVDLL